MGSSKSTVVTVMNMKGGVGKTTVTVNLGGIISTYTDIGKAYKKILLIDYDPQFNLSQAYIHPREYFPLEEKRKTILAVLQDDETELNPYTIQTPENDTPPKVTDIKYNVHRRHDLQLDIIPSTLDLMYIALGQVKRIQTIENRFRKFITDAPAKSLRLWCRLPACIDI